MDTIARERAEAAHTKMDGHEQLCAERYKNIHDRVGLILKLLGWGGSIVTTIMLAVVGFLALRAVSANDANQELLRVRFEQMEHRMDTPMAPARATEDAPRNG